MPKDQKQVAFLRVQGFFSFFAFFGSLFFGVSGNNVSSEVFISFSYKSRSFIYETVLNSKQENFKCYLLVGLSVVDMYSTI